MGKMNVAQFATELGLPVELLLEQLQAAGTKQRYWSTCVAHTEAIQEKSP
jgi:hypothetical protein